MVEPTYDARTPRLPDPMMAEPGRALSLRDFYYVVFRHKTIVLTFLFAVTLSAAYILLITPDTYTSNAQVLVRQGRESRVDPTVTAMGADVRLYAEWEQQFKSQLAIMTSRTLAEQAAKRIGPGVILGSPGNAVEQRVPLLTSLKGWVSSIAAKLQQGIRSEPAEGDGRPAELDAAALQIMSAFKVSVPEKSNIIALEYTSTDPNLAQSVLEAITETYLDEHLEIYRSHGSYDFFTEQVERLRSQLETLENQIRAMNNELGIASLDARRSHVANRVAGLETEIARTEVEINASQAKAEVLRERLSGVVPEPSLAREPDTRGKSRSMFDQAAYSDAKIQLLHEEAGAAALTAQAVSLREQLTEARKELQSLNDREIRVSQMQREMSVLEGKYRVYAEHLEQARIDKQLEAEKFSSVSVVEHATYPVQPTGQNRQLKLALAFLFGLGGGIGLAYLREFLDSSLRRPEDVEAHLQLPTLSSIPHLSKKQLSLVPGDALTLPQDGASYVPFEILRDRVLLSLNGAAARPVMLALTSTHSGEGVSTVAANLAVALAQGGDQRVLFVDANFQQPAANRIFGVKQAPGLAEILSDGEGNTATIERNLYVLSAGQREVRGSQELVPQRFDRVMQMVRENHYDYVIFDIPAMTQGTTAARLAHRVDGVILVSESEKVRWEAALRVKDLLAEAQANILGVVLNKRRYYVPEWLYRKL